MLFCQLKTVVLKFSIFPYLLLTNVLEDDRL